MVEQERKEFEATNQVLLGRGDSERTLTKEEMAGATGDLNSLVQQYAMEQTGLTAIDRANPETPADSTTQTSQGDCPFHQKPTCHPK